MTFASSVQNLSSGNESFLRKGSIGAPQLYIFCWRNQIPTLDKFWTIVHVNINISQSAEFKTHFGETYEEVEFLADTEAVFWFLSEPTRPSTTIILSPFLSSCLGITSDSSFILDCSLVHFDIPSFLLTLFGIFVFFCSNFLSTYTLVASTSRNVIRGVFSWVLVAGKISNKHKLSSFTSVGLKSLSLYLTFFAWYGIYNFDRLGGRNVNNRYKFYLTCYLRLLYGHHFIVFVLLLQLSVSG